MGKAILLMCNKGAGVHRKERCVYCVQLLYLVPSGHLSCVIGVRGQNLLFV